MSVKTIAGPTPGPWKAIGPDVRVGRSTWTASDLSPEAGSNARLMAAAPELLAALHLYADEDNCICDLERREMDKPCIRCRARAAIEKAEGGQ